MDFEGFPRNLSDTKPMYLGMFWRQSGLPTETMPDFGIRPNKGSETTNVEILTHMALQSAVGLGRCECVANGIRSVWRTSLIGHFIQWDEFVQNWDTVYLIPTYPNLSQLIFLGYTTIWSNKKRRIFWSILQDFLGKSAQHKLRHQSSSWNFWWLASRVKSSWNLYQFPRSSYISHIFHVDFLDLPINVQEFRIFPIYFHIFHMNFLDLPIKKKTMDRTPWQGRTRTAQPGPLLGISGEKGPGASEERWGMMVSFWEPNMGLFREWYDYTVYLYVYIYVCK